MADVLKASLRDSLGRQRSKRLRVQGLIPAELYGHGQPNAHLSLEAGEVRAAIKHGAHLVELKGAVNESALIREVQWDHYGIEVLHLDLARVSAEETVEVTLHVEIRGTAAGLKDGGVLQTILHDVKIRCPAGLIPDKLEAKVANLRLGGQFTAGDLELPAGASLITAADQVVVQCVTPLDQEAAAAVPGEVIEPELIRKPKEAEEGEDKE